jgi:hypothetical protein
MNPDLALFPVLLVTLGFALMAIMFLRSMGQLVTTRRKLRAADLKAMQLENENGRLRYQLEKDRTLERAKRGDYGATFELCKKTGGWRVT